MRGYHLLLSVLITFASLSAREKREPFDLDILELSLKRVTPHLYAPEARFFEAVTKQVSELNWTTDLEPIFARLFLLNALRPIVEDVQTLYFEKEVVPLYLKALQKWNRKLQMESLSDFILTQKTLDVTITLLQQALIFCGHYATDKAIIEETERLGQSLAQKPAPEVMALAQGAPLLCEGDRTQAFKTLIEMLLEYLKTQID